MTLPNKNGMCYTVFSKCGLGDENMTEGGLLVFLGILILFVVIVAVVVVISTVSSTAAAIVEDEDGEDN